MSSEVGGCAAIIPGPIADAVFVVDAFANSGAEVARPFTVLRPVFFIEHL